MSSLPERLLSTPRPAGSPFSSTTLVAKFRRMCDRAVVPLPSIPKYELMEIFFCNLSLGSKYDNGIGPTLNIRGHATAVNPSGFIVLNGLRSLFSGGLLSSSWSFISFVIDCHKSLPYLYSSSDFLRLSSKSVSLLTCSFSSLISENNFARLSPANCGRNDGGLFFGSLRNDFVM